MRVSLIQLTSSDDPHANIPLTCQKIAEAADDGAQLILTPEVTNCVSASRTRQTDVLCTEKDDPTLRRFREEAAQRRVWILIGSLALKSTTPGGQFVNRSFLVDPMGEVIARYDKLHMFDVQVSATETYRESAAYRPGSSAIYAEIVGIRLGLTICYDLRFPALFRSLAQVGCKLISVPSAFSPETGPDHWEVLLRARAIECGSFVLAPAQSGTHPGAMGRMRRSYGHSIVVSPWGEVLARAGAAAGVTTLDLDLTLVDDARRRVPSLTHDRAFEGR